MAKQAHLVEKWLKKVAEEEKKSPNRHPERVKIITLTQLGKLALQLGPPSQERRQLISGYSSFILFHL